MDRSSQSATWCRILPESTVHTYDHTSCPMLSDLYTICDRIFGEGSAESAKVQLDWKCFFKAKKGTMFSRDNRWTNAANMGQGEWYKIYVRPFHFQLVLVGMLVSACSCESNWSAH